MFYFTIAIILLALIAAGAICLGWKLLGLVRGTTPFLVILLCVSTTMTAGAPGKARKHRRPKPVSTKPSPTKSQEIPEPEYWTSQSCDWGVAVLGTEKMKTVCWT